MPPFPAGREKSASRNGHRPSAKDVARLAGVSTATVSRAINTPDQVDVETRQLVRDAVAKLRYVPHGAARALRSHRSQMVGAVVPSFDYALYARTTSALQAVLDPKGYAMVLAEHHYDLEAELRITGQLIGHGVDAFVFVGLDHHPALFSLLESYGRPYVLTWGVDPMRRHPSIGFDNRAATFEMTRHLLALGHRRFGLLSAATDGNDRATERGAGVRAALAQAGLTLDERCAEYGADRPAGGGRDDAAPAGRAAAPDRRRRHQRRLRRRRDDRLPRSRACAFPRTSRSPASTTPTSAPRRRRRSPASARRSSRSAAPPPTS